MIEKELFNLFNFQELFKPGKYSKSDYGKFESLLKI